MAKGDYSNILNSTVRDMLKDFDLSSEADSTNRRNGLDAISFYRGGRAQWDENLWKFRTNDNRPTESYNQIPKFIRQITNDIRQNKTQTRFIANTDGSKPVAEKMEDLARAIQSTSEAEVAYDNAAFNQVVNGWGYWRVLTDYENANTFDQVIKIKWVPNPFKIYDDPFVGLQDFSDRSFLIEVEDMKLSDFNEGRDDEEKYDSLDLQSIGDCAPEWASSDNSVRVAEYWKVRNVKSKLYKNKETGEISREEPEDYSKATYDVRDVVKPKIMWYKCTAIDVLEEREWDGIYIPYVRVSGETIYENNKIYYYGAVEAMKPPQRLYNYAANSIVEAVASQPKAPYLAAVGQITEPLAKFWDNANTKNYAWLPYNPVTVNGQVVGPPQRQQVSADIASMVEVLQMAQQGFNEASGQFQAAIGAPSNEKSGIAIQRRQHESDVSTYHFPDNLARAQRFEGRILADLFPKVYDGARDIQLLKEDNKEYSQKINQETTDKYGQPVNYDLTAGTYDVMIDTGPSYTTKRQEAADMQMQLFQAAPEAMMPALPTIIRNTDMPGADKIAEAVERGMPPQLRDPEIQDEAMKQVPPAVQAQLQQAGQMVQTLTGQLQQAQAIANDKQAEDQAKLLDAHAKVASAQNEQMKDEAEAQYKLMELNFEKEKYMSDRQLQEDELKLEWAKLEIERMKSSGAGTMSLSNKNPATPTLPVTKNILQAQMIDLEQSEAVKQQKDLLDQSKAAESEQLENAKFERQSQSMDMLMGILGSIKVSLDHQAQATTELTNSVRMPKAAIKTQAGEWVVQPIAPAGTA